MHRLRLETPGDFGPLFGRMNCHLWELGFEMLWVQDLVFYGGPHTGVNQISYAPVKAMLVLTPT